MCRALFGNDELIQRSVPVAPCHETLSVSISGHSCFTVGSDHPFKQISEKFQVEPPVRGSLSPSVYACSLGPTAQVGTVYFHLPGTAERRAKLNFHLFGFIFCLTGWVSVTIERLIANCVAVQVLGKES